MRLASAYSTASGALTGLKRVQPCNPQYAAEKKSKGTNVSLDRPCEKGNPPPPAKQLSKNNFGVLWCSRPGCQGRRDACTTSYSRTAAKRPICHLSTSRRRTLARQSPIVPCLLLSIGA
jgi:hypothetical protein